MAVKGLDRFKTYFAEDEDQYVMIGCAACDQWFTEQQLMFRATVDLDFVLILEEINPDFIRKLWRFIEDGGYALGNEGKSRQPVYIVSPTPLIKVTPRSWSSYHGPQGLLSTPLILFYGML